MGNSVETDSEEESSELEVKLNVDDKKRVVTDNRFMDFEATWNFIGIYPEGCANYEGCEISSWKLVRDWNFI